MTFLTPRRLTVVAFLPLLGLVAGQGYLPVPKNTRSIPYPEQQQQQRQRQQQQRQAPPPQAPPSTAPSALTKAESDLQHVEDRLRAAFEKSDDYVKATAELRDAETNYESARKAATEALKSNADYTAALDQQKAAEDALNQARASGSTDQMPALATAAMNARQAVHKLEATAADADPAVVEAKTKLTAAQDKLKGLREQFRQSMQADPDYVAARKAVEEARGKSAKG